jgi:4-amino-4-deoxy-L-arabinose transferase-like glycosyltransferase
VTSTHDVVAGERVDARTTTPSRSAKLRAAIARLPRALWLCAAIATINAATWSFLTPAFQVPDEPVHAGYAQYLAETGRVPRPTGVGFYWNPPPDADLAFQRVPFSILGQPTWSKGDNRALQDALAKHPPSKAEGGAGYASSNPPLYYVWEAIPYRLAASGTFLDRLQAMRLGSALLAGLTVAFIFLFLRELLPRARWAWTVGALAVAFQPMFGFVAGGVNNDNLVWTCSAALLFGIARSFRLGLTPRRGAFIGLALAGGLLTKGSVFGLMPGAALGVLLAAWRTDSAHRREALMGIGAAAGAAAIPVVAWLIANPLIWDRPSSTTTSSFSAGPTFSPRELLSYTWQFYLPRLPFMTDEWPFAGQGFLSYPTYPLWQTYFQGFVGRFGWFQYGFPMWANWVALGVFVPVVGLAGAALVRSRKAVRRRWPELLTYVVLLGGLMALINLVGYQYRLGAPHSNFEQARYLLPMVGLYAAVIALAARGAGRRWGPALGVLLVVLAAGHNVSAQLLSLDRYYAAPVAPTVTDGGAAPMPKRGELKITRPKRP